MSVRVSILADHICIEDERGEIAYWDRQEWLDDPDLILSIANAIRVACTQGGDAARQYPRCPTEASDEEDAVRHTFVNEGTRED